MANSGQFCGLALRGSRLILISAVLLAGCTHLGPRSVAVDRFDYSTAIADSWKQQTLLNIVKVRYMDLPVFVDVASIVAGYSLQTGVSVGGVSSSGGAVQGDFGSLGAQDMVNFGPPETIPQPFKHRLFYRHNAYATLMRTNRDCVRRSSMVRTPQ